MLSTRLNPFAAILAVTIIGACGTLFVVQKTFETDFTYAHEDARVGVTTADLLRDQ